MRFIYIVTVFYTVFAFIQPGTAGTLEEADRSFGNGDYRQAFEVYLPLAEQGVPEAMVQVAKIYQYGWLDHKAHDSEPLRWYLSAARHSNAEGAFGAAQMYRIGRKVDQDYKAAADLYRQAAEAGHAEAAAFLGQLYYQGRGVEEDLEQAATWLRVGAKESMRARGLLDVMKQRGQLAQNGSVLNKPHDSAVAGTRQTVTVVRTKPPAEIKYQAENAEHEKQIEVPEAWAMTISGFGILFAAVLAFFFPKLFMYGRRSFFWKDLIGERATAIMIRVISVLAGAVGILLAVGGIIDLTSG